MCSMEHQPFSLPFKLEIVKYHSPSSNHLLDTTCAKKAGARLDLAENDIILLHFVD